jgi:hypothetical protein
MGNGPAGRFKELLGVIMKSEVLDELPVVGPDPQRQSVFSRLMKSEDLPYDAPPVADRRSSLPTGLFSAELLPMDERPEPRIARTPFMSRLFSKEQLPFDPTPERGVSKRGPGG